MFFSWINHLYVAFLIDNGHTPTSHAVLVPVISDEAIPRYIFGILQDLSKFFWLFEPSFSDDSNMPINFFERVYEWVQFRVEREHLPTQNKNHYDIIYFY